MKSKELKEASNIIKVPMRYLPKMLNKKDNKKR